MKVHGLTLKQTVTELSSLSANCIEILIVGELQSLRIIQLGPAEAQE